MPWAIFAVAAVVLLLLFLWARGKSPTRPAPRHQEPEPPPLEDLVAPELRPHVRQLRHHMPLVVAPAAVALGQSGHPDAVLPLIHTLGNDQRSVRFAVVEALLALSAHAVGPLQEATRKCAG